MAVDHVRGALGGDAADTVADTAELLRTRQVSGYAPRPAPSQGNQGRALEVTTGAETETTRIVPDQLIETLLEASRYDSEPPAYAPRSAPPPAESPALQQRKAVPREDAARRRPSPVRLAPIAAALTGISALTCLVALQLGLVRAPDAWLRGEVDARAASPARPPIPIVVKLRRAEPARSLLAIEALGPGSPQASEHSGMPVSGSLASAEGRVQPEAEKLAPAAGEAQRKWTRALARGQSRLSARQFDSAVWSFERAIGYNPNDPQAYAGLAVSQLERGKWNEAVRAFRKAIALAPEDAAQRSALLLAFEQADKKELVATYGAAAQIETEPFE